MQRKYLVGGLFMLTVSISLIPFNAQASIPSSNFQVDITSRENVRNFYNAVYNASNDISADWMGDISNCNSGQSSQQHKEATLRRINFFRAMAGVPAWITFTGSANAKARSAALLASANNALSHYPPSSWDCYSPIASQASASSNIALGETGPNAITAYIEDAGSHNLSVGHRRWLFYPQTKIMGTGDISPASGTGQKASAINVFDDQYGQIRPETRNEYVSWPPAGFVPYQMVFPRWSFSIPHADFSQAQVTVTLNNQAIGVNVYPAENGYGENTLVWEIKSTDLVKPNTDLVYQVSVNNVLINRRFVKNYTYQVKAFDPAIQGHDSIVSNITGSSEITSGQTNQYVLSTIPSVDRYEVLRAQRMPYQRIANAEIGLEQLQTNTSGASHIISNFTASSGQKAYYLSHLSGVDQHLSFDKQFLVHSDSSLNFDSRINCAMPDESARVQVSIDDGASWIDIYNQAGVRFGLRESDFTTQSINLSAFAGNIIRVRFNFTFKSGWRCITANSGWYLDDIVFNHVDALTNIQLTTISHPSFQFSPTQVTDYVLVVRGILFNGFTGQWGAAFPVQVKPDTPEVNVPPISQPSIDNPATENDPQRSMILKSADGSERRCEYTKARIDLNGDIKLTLTDLTCLTDQ